MTLVLPNRYNNWGINFEKWKREKALKELQILWREESRKKENVEKRK